MGKWYARQRESYSFLSTLCVDTSFSHVQWICRAIDRAQHRFKVEGLIAALNLLTPPNISLGHAEMYMGMAAVFRRFTFELFETD
jgi:hypothetical protein